MKEKLFLISTLVSCLISILVLILGCFAVVSLEKHQREQEYIMTMNLRNGYDCRLDECVKNIKEIDFRLQMIEAGTVAVSVKRSAKLKSYRDVYDRFVNSTNIANKQEKEIK